MTARVEVFQTEPVLDDTVHVQVLDPDPDYAHLDDEDFFAMADKVAAEASRRRLVDRAARQAESAVKTWHAASGHRPGGTWVQPTGAHDAYPKNWTVEHEGKTWQSLIPNNVWEPGVTGWREKTQDGQPDQTHPEWVQPLGAHDAYDAGDVVAWGGNVWVSTLNGNVWEPGVYGWEKEEG